MGTLIVNQYLNFGLDSDAATYIAAVESADGQPLESTTKKAVNDFVVGCKTDGIWDAIKASCILVGARTLAGALTPLAGTAPTNFNFVAGDYDRKTGLKGDGSTKYLDSNRNNNADPQNNNHNALYVSTIPTNPPTGQCYMAVGSATNEVGVNNIIYTFDPGFTRHAFRNRKSATVDVASSPVVGLLGTSRSLEVSFVYRLSSISTNVSSTSQTPRNANVIIFATENGNYATNARFAFYSIGESLDLALLDARVTQLMADINNAF